MMIVMKTHLVTIPPFCAFRGRLLSQKIRTVFEVRLHYQRPCNRKYNFMKECLEWIKNTNTNNQKGFRMWMWIKYRALLTNGLAFLALGGACYQCQGKRSGGFINSVSCTLHTQGTDTVPQQATMLNYIEPEYTLVKQESGRYKIEVRASLYPKTLCSEEAKEIRLQTLQKEACKDPLFAIAFVQSLANKGDVQAKQIQTLYQAYRRFLKDGQHEGLRKTCYLLMQDKNIDSLVLSFTKCIDVYFEGNGIPSQLEDAHQLLNQLIPNLKQTLTMPLPQKLYPEQQVIIEEEPLAGHRAFPDLIRYKGECYLCFREAQSHVGFNDFGKIRILKGIFDAKTQVWRWKTEALIAKAGYDLRDPRFFIDGVDELRMIIGGSQINENDETVWMTPHVAKLKKGAWHLSEASVDPSANGPKGQWIWRVTWNPFDHCGYGFSYGKPSLYLMKTVDGLAFSKVTEIEGDSLSIPLSEGTIRFKSDGTALALIRGKKRGIIALSAPGNRYMDWSISSLPFRLGGPNFLIAEERKEVWAATRYFFLHEDNSLDEATILGRMDQQTLLPALRIKSKGDNSYPGMVFEEDGRLTVAYYSSESESMSNIYITSFKLPK